MYDLSGSSRLLALLKEVTHPDRGRVLVAAKAYYFGVGGGSREFARLVQDDGHFDVSLAAERLLNVLVLSSTHVPVRDSDKVVRRTAPPLAVPSGVGEPGRRV